LAHPPLLQGDYFRGSRGEELREMAFIRFVRRFLELNIKKKSRPPLIIKNTVNHLYNYIYFTTLNLNYYDIIYNIIYNNALLI